MTKKELLYFLVAIITIGGIITTIFLLLPGGNNFQEPIVIFEIGELQSAGGDLFDLPVNITCLNTSITLISVSSNPCISLGIFNNESVEIIPFFIPVNETQTIFLRCSFNENIIYLIEFHFQMQGYTFTKNLKFEY
ncbi:MAG: hypothetical protein KAS47_05830 [Candidatus Heimdallarchaeota archaeon]|nr:hypothetical protein [Candidatus Heimdallarchaeota archaeon]